MAVGIPELGGQQPEDSDEEGSNEKEGEKGEGEEEEEKEKVDGATPFKPKTRWVHNFDFFIRHFKYLNLSVVCLYALVKNF